MTLRPSQSRLWLALGILIVPALSACGQGQAPKAPEAAPVQAAPESAQPSSLAAPTAAPAAPMLNAIRTAAGPEGSTVELTRVQVTANVLSVELRYTPPAAENSTQWVYIDLPQVSVIDDATSQRFGVLQDQEKKWMAAPVEANRIRMPLRNGHAGVVWFKFPAPPADSATVSVNIPNVSPFDGVPVQR